MAGITANTPTCLHCKGPTGILFVRGTDFVVRCTACGRPTGYEPPVIVPLPPVSKKVVYLDQNVYAHIQSGEWKELDFKLSEAVRSQAILCPLSDLHDNEAMLFKVDAAGREKVMESLSLGARLYAERDVRLFQITDAANAWLDGESPSELGVSNVLMSGSVDRWVDRIRVRVTSPGVDGLEEELRANRHSLHQTMQGIVERWSGTGKSSASVFSTVYDEESRAFGLGCVKAYGRFLESKAGKNVTLDDLQSTMSMEAVTRVTYEFRQRDMDYVEAAGKAMEFLVSDAMLDVPFLRIQSSIWASVAQAAAAGQKKYLPSTPNDVTIASTYLPYCDAMFLDNNMAGLFRNNPLQKSLRDWGFNCEVYSARTSDDFIAYLDDLLTDTPDDQRMYANLLYGAGS